jgi:hypothetical protein
MERKVKLAKRMLIAGAYLTFALPALAHHSFAMFDLGKPVQLAGTVREFQWRNPHCFIQLLVQRPGDARNAVDEWSIEMTSPGQLIRAGWKPTTVMAGEKITVVIYPLRDGGKGGSYASGTGPHGKLGGSQ